MTSTTRTAPRASPWSIVSQSIAQRLFPNGDAVNRRLTWTHPLTGKPVGNRIVGVVADVDDENVVRGPAMAFYLPLRQMGIGGRLFVRTSGDPYALVPSVTRVVRGISPEQAVERAATLEDVRAEVLSPERLNAFVFSGVRRHRAADRGRGRSRRARVFGQRADARVRRAAGCRFRAAAPADRVSCLKACRLPRSAWRPARRAATSLARVAATYVEHVQLPGALPVLASAAVLIGAAVLASLMPAARASRVDVLQALRSE